MPDKDALYRSFNQLLGSLDLPDDKIEEMNSYDDHKKWEILCSRSLMKAHQSPGFYLHRMRSFVGLKAPHPKTDVIETLRGLEVSLRTYPIDWFHNFLIEKNSLDTLVDLVESNMSPECFQVLTQCFKVIMSDPKGFSMAINHPRLADALVRSLSSASMKNRSNILQLLTVACEKSADGHERILNSLEHHGGLDQLMDFLTLHHSSEQMVIVSALGLIKAVINSPIDMNYRVYLQFAFHKIGLNNRIERLLTNESGLMAEVIEEIKSYESMIINVNQLVKDRAEIKAFEERLRKSEAMLMDAERQSINGVRSTSWRVTSVWKIQFDFVPTV